MKKALVSLLVLGFAALVPLGVFAKTSPFISNTPDKETNNGDGTITRVYSIFINTTENEELEDATIGFQYGSAVTKLTCAGAGDFDLDSQSTTGASSVSCTFAAEDEAVSGEKILVGQVTVVVNEDADDEDCSIDYVFDGATGTINKENPKTGASVPYVFIAGGILVAAGAFLVTRRNTKLYKI